jgi:hypothetical protein
LDSTLLKDCEVELGLGSRRVCVCNFHAQYSTAQSDVVYSTKIFTHKGAIGLVVILEVLEISLIPAYNESERFGSSLISIGQLRDHSKIYPTGMLRRVQLIDCLFDS